MDLFIIKAHHYNMFVFFNSQYLFTKEARIARNNAQYIFLMKSPNAMLTIRNLGSQLFPGQTEYFLSAYKNATEKPYQYLLIDMHPTSHDALRLRTCIFPNELNVMYFPKDY